MDKLHAEGMQGLAFHKAPRAAVEIIAYEGMAQAGAVDADLMRPACMEHHFEQTVIGAGCEPADIRVGRLAGYACTALNNTARQAFDWPVHGYQRCRKDAFTKGGVKTVVRQVLAAEGVLDLRLLGNEAEAGRVAV